MEYFFLHFFVQATLTLIINLYKTVSIRENSKQSNTLFSSIAHGFSNLPTAEMVNDLNHNHREKRKLAVSTSKSHDNFLTL